MGAPTQGQKIPGYAKIAIFFLVLSLVEGLIAGCVPEIDPFRDRNPGLPADTRYGIAVTPGPEGVEKAFALAGEITDYEVFIAQWSEYSPAQMRAVVQFCRKHGLTPILSISPTTLDQGRKELDLPSAVRRKAGSNISFGNPVIREAFKQAVREIAGLRPPYLCLATEINFLAVRLAEFLHFVTLYKEAYRVAKAVSPETKVFVSFQWEFARILDAREPGKIAEHTKVFDVFRPELDAVGLTTYPSAFHSGPADLAPDYYSYVFTHLRRKDTILFTEVGWPSAGSGTETEQAAFLRGLPGRMREVRPALIAWSLLHDVDIPQFDANLGTTGLITPGGRKKPAFHEFRALNAGRR